MDLVIANNNIESFSTAILVASEKEANEIEREIDNYFYEYAFYPEEDWVVYDCKPPNGYQVLGAWRHPFVTSYAFLLNNSGRDKSFSNIQLIIYIKADKKHIHKIVSSLHKLKLKYSFKDFYLDERIDRVHKLKIPVFMMSLLGAFTAIINTFSLYIMKIPEPIINNIILRDIYNSLTSIFHLLAMLFLINFCLICIYFLTKYGLLIVRKV